MPSSTEAAIWKIAQVAHETWRAWQKANGVAAAPSWARAPKWMRDASYEAVLWRIANPKAPVSAQHEQWVKLKKETGWKYGKVKSGVKKTHPMLVPFSELSETERRKDAAVAAVIAALSQPMK